MVYRKLPRNSVIDPEVALLQGAGALDAAGVIAENMSDVEGLLNVAAMWMKFGEHIQGFVEKVEEAEKKAENAAREGEIVKVTTPKIEMGFQCEKPEADPEEITVEEGEEID